MGGESRFLGLGVIAAFGAVRDFSLKLPTQPRGAHGGSMIKLFRMVAQTNVLLLKCRQRSWCELCMYTNELCCCMLLWWLPSLLGIDPSGVKTGRKEGRRRATSSSNRTAWHSTVASHQVQGLFRHVLGKPYGPEFELHQRVFLVFFHRINVNPSMKMGIIHSCFAIGSFGCCLYVGSQRWVMSWQLMITKQSPRSPRDLTYSQMCFD